MYVAINHMWKSKLKPFYIHRALKGSPYQQRSRLHSPNNSAWYRISSGERCYLWRTSTVHHDQRFTWWWMRGEPRVINLGSVSWEVIHMTSRAIRGLVPNLSGDNRCISSSHLSPFSCLPPSWETAHQKDGHLSVWPWTRSQAQLYVCTLLVCACLLLPADVYAAKTKGDEDQLSHRLSRRSHPSGLDLTLVDGSCPVVHALTLDGSKALSLCSRSWRSGWTH